MCDDCVNFFNLHSLFFLIFTFFSNIDVYVKRKGGRMSTRKSKKKSTRINNTLLCILLVVMVAVIGAFSWNIYKVSKKGNNTDVKEVETEKAKNEYTNAYYTIGNNAIDIDKEYFKELNKAVDANDTTQIASDLVKCFITEYYTWTNKDGNYDVGGIQYIFTDRQSDFASYTRNSYYADMDLYISQLGTENLMQVANVEITGAAPSEDMVVLNANGEEVSYPCVTVTANWSYESCSMDLSSAQTSGTFQVVNHDGRMEIASIQ